MTDYYGPARIISPPQTVGTAGGGYQWTPQGRQRAEVAGERSHPVTTGPGAHVPARWPSTPLCQQDLPALCPWGSRKARPRLCRVGGRTGLEPLPQETARSAASPPEAWRCSLPTTIAPVGAVHRSPGVQTPQAGPGRRGKGSRGARRELRVRRARSVSHSSAMALWATTVCLLF